MNNDINNLQSTSAYSAQDLDKVESAQEQQAQTTTQQDKDETSKSSTTKTSRDFSTPSLAPPEFKEAGGGAPTQANAAPTNEQTSEMEATAFNILESMVLEQFLDQTISETAAKQMAQQAVQQTINQHMHAGPVSDTNFAQVMASMGEQILRSMSGKKPTDELAQTVNKLKAKATAETNPEFNVLQEMLKNQNLKKKMPVKQAEDEAIKNALDMSKGDEFSDENLLGSKAQTSKAIADALTQQLGKDDYAHGMALGISESLKIASSALGILQGTNQVNPTAEVDKVNRTNAEKVLKNVLTSLTEIVEETKAAILSTSKAETTSAVVGGTGATGGIVPGLPGSGQNQSTLAMLTYVASIIAQFQQILGTLVVADNANASQLSQEQVQETNTQMQLQLDQLQEQQKKMDSPWQKILNIVLTVVTTVLSVLAAPFSMGASLLEMAAVLSIIAATSITTSVLSSTGVLQKAFTDLTTDITNALAKTGAPKWVQDLTVGLVMVTIIVAAALVARGAASSIASSVISTAVKQTTVQLVCLLVSSSGVFTDIANTICTAAGASEKTTMIVNIVVNVIGCIAMAGYAMKASQDIMQEFADNAPVLDEGSADKSETMQKIQEFSNKTQTFLKYAQAGSSALQAGNSAYGGAQTIQEANVQYQMADLGAQIQVITALIALLQQSLQDMMGQSGSKGLMSLQVGLYDLFSGMVQSQSQAMSGLGGSLKSSA